MRTSRRLSQMVWGAAWTALIGLSGCAQLDDHIGLVTADVSTESETPGQPNSSDEIPSENRTERAEQPKGLPKDAFFLGANARTPGASASEMNQELQSKMICMPEANPAAVAATTASKASEQPPATMEELRERVKESVEKQGPQKEVAAEARDKNSEKAAVDKTDKKENRTPAAVKGASIQAVSIIMLAVSIFFLAIAMIVRSVQDRNLRKMAEEYYQL